MNYGSGGFEYSGGKAIIIGNNDKLSNNLLIHACMTGHGECAYGDLESMECRDQDGGHSYYKLVETIYIDSEKVSHVGLLLDKSKIVHSSGKVRIDNFTSEGIVQDGKLIYKTISIRRILFKTKDKCNG
jgi:hypothetical protein